MPSDEQRHAAAVRHGDGNAPSISECRVLMESDPDLALVYGDIHAWYLIHDANCNCDGVCKCEEKIDE